MPIQWTISHADRLVEVAATGPVRLKDVERYLDAIVVAGAMTYGKLFDATAMEAAASDDDMMQLGARVQAYARTFAAGPIAFVVTGPEAEDYLRRFINLGAAKRPMKIFRTEAQARVWLEEQRT